MSLAFVAGLLAGAAATGSAAAGATGRALGAGAAGSNAGVAARPGSAALALTPFKVTDISGEVEIYTRPIGRYVEQTCLASVQDLADGDQFTALQRCGRTITFSSAVTKRSVPSGWATWASPPYTEGSSPAVLRGRSGLTITLSRTARVVGFELEPNYHASHTFTVRFFDRDGVAVGSVTRTVHGLAGARLVAALGPTRGIKSARIVASDDFALARLRIGDDYIPQRQLVALGDSYSSGEGNPPFYPESGDCRRSPEAWPRTVVRQGAGQAFVGFHACSGATTRALTNRFKDEEAQLDALARHDGVDIVTITIGGNDIKFGPILRDCFLWDCGERLDDVPGDIADLAERLPGIYRRIRREAPSARLVVVGYPRLFPETQGETTHCGWLEPHERRSLNDLGDLLDATLRTAAASAEVEYVSVLDTLDGHELCSHDSWVYRLALTGGANRGHPTAPGQRVIALRVLEYLG